MSIGNRNPSRSDLARPLLNAAARTFDVVYKCAKRGEGIVDIKGPIPPSMYNLLSRKIHTHVSHRNHFPMTVEVMTEEDFKVEYKGDLHSKLSVMLKLNKVKVFYLCGRQAKGNSFGGFKIIPHSGPNSKFGTECTTEKFGSEEGRDSVDVKLIKVFNAKSCLIEFPELRIPIEKLIVNNPYYQVNPGEIALTQVQ